MEKEELVQTTKNKMQEIKALIPDYRGIVIVIGNDAGAASTASFKNNKDIMPVFLQLAAAFADKFKESNPFKEGYPKDMEQHICTYAFLSTAMQAMELKYDIDPMPVLFARMMWDKKRRSEGGNTK